MGLSIGAAADFVGSLFASDAGVAAGADVAAGAGAGAAEAGSLTASDLALTAGADGATAVTSEAGSTASEVAEFQGVGGTGEELAAAAGGASSGQYLSAAQTALSGVQLAKTLLTPRPNLAGPSAPSPLPQAAQVPSAMIIQSGIGGGGGGSPAVAPTLLTGGGGVDPSGLSLGRNTLLGN